MPKANLFVKPTMGEGASVAAFAGALGGVVEEGITILQLYLMQKCIRDSAHCTLVPYLKSTTPYL